MGVSGLWDILRPAARTESLSQLAVTHGFQVNAGGQRGFRIGIDASIWFCHGRVFNGNAVSKGAAGEHPQLRMLFFRCAQLMRLPLLPLFVFDGLQRPEWKRGTRVSKRSNSSLVKGMESIIQAFGYECTHALGEAEAELAYLNRIGVIDAVLTDDVDALLFGATMVIRNPSAALNGNRAHPIRNSEGRVDKNHVNCYAADDLHTHSKIRLTQGGLILIGLMRGGDYHPAGVRGIGAKIARALAECGFGDQLVEAVQTLQRGALDDFLNQWRTNIVSELRTNSRGILGKKYAALANCFPADFPDLKVVHAYVNPVVSGTYDTFHKIQWQRDPDLMLLAKLCEDHFEWGYREAILKRFRTIIWPGVVCRILRRSVLLADETALAPDTWDTAGSSPQKAPPVPAPGAPIRMIAEYFSQLDRNSPVLQPFEAWDAAPLITGITRQRRHVSTDGLPEYRLEIAPLQLARIAEQGILGTRNSRKTPRGPVALDDAMRVWMPACMVKLVEPGLVHEYECAQERKRRESKGKGVPVPRQVLSANSNAAAIQSKTLAAVRYSLGHLSDSSARGASGNLSESSDNLGDISDSSDYCAIEDVVSCSNKTRLAQTPLPSARTAPLLLAHPPYSASPASSPVSRITAYSPKQFLLPSTPSSTAPPIAKTQKLATAALTDVFGPLSVNLSKEPSACPFFSDDEGPVILPGRRKGPSKRKASRGLKQQPRLLKQATRSRSREQGESDGELTDGLRKSPRKNKQQTTPRASHRQHPGSAQGAFDALLPKTVSVADVIIISSSEEERGVIIISSSEDEL